MNFGTLTLVSVVPVS